MADESRQPVYGDIIFLRDGREVMRITHAGELIIQDASEAAQLLHDEWLRIRACTASSTREGL